MHPATASLSRFTHRVVLVAIFLGATTVVTAQAPIVQPGAPGEPARELSAEDAVEIAEL